MSNVIRFLESLGAQPALSPMEYAATVAVLGVDGEQKQALLDRNQTTLNDLVGGRPTMLCFIATPDDQQQDMPDDQDGDGVPDQDEPQHEKE